jgi:hypothetical protein
MAMADVRQTGPDPELRALQEKLRARRSDDRPGERPTGEFLATRARVTTSRAPIGRSCNRPPSSWMRSCVGSSGPVVGR